MSPERRETRARRSLLLGLVVLCGACASQATPPTTPPDGSGATLPAGGPATDQLVADLRSLGARVELLGEVEQPFFSVRGTLLSVNDSGPRVQVFEYRSEQEAAAQAARVSPDGYQVGLTQVDWLATPHFFRSGVLVVLYVGDAQEVISALATVLGPQFAGGR